MGDRTVGIRDVNQNAGKLIREVKRTGKSITIAHHNDPIAVPSPLPPQDLSAYERLVRDGTAKRAQSPIEDIPHAEWDLKEPPTRHWCSDSNDGTIASMTTFQAAEIPGGVVHELPEILRAALTTSPTMLAAWRDITPLARNEFICWIIDAKQSATREKRVRVAEDKLNRGERRPCCWPGCPHRERTGHA